MNYKTLFTTLCCIALLVAIPGQKALGFFQDRPQSYAEANLSTATPTVLQPTGASTLGDLSIASTSGAVFRTEYNTWALNTTIGTGITLSFNVALPGRIQVAMYVAAALVNGSADNPYHVMVTNSFGTNQLTTTALTDTVPNFHWNVIEIPQHLVAAGENKVTVYLDTDASTQLFIQNIKLLPQKLRAQYGNLNTTLYTQFGESSVNGPITNGGKMWTRAYGLDSLIEMLPGPTFYFDPGDLLNVNMVNKLNKETNSLLKEYEKLNSAPAFYEDEALVGDSVRGEINIPHNIDNTNLHVHGLHVDPSKDDVTIVIVPEGVDTTGYDAPHTHAPVDDDFTILNEFSVSDQEVKKGSWDYQYKIPYIHLPGTHWYHPHKHGSTSAQVENGLAGTIVIQENENNAIVPYPNTTGTTKGGGNQSNYDLEDWRSYHDRVLAVQEITNFGLQLGKGNGNGAISTGNIQTTVNGEVLPTIRFAPGQLERWRVVNAGTNHRAFSQVWLGKYIATKDTTYSYTHPVKSGGKTKNVTNDTTVTYQIYKSVPIQLAAVDGITLSELRTVTAEKPALMAPGNRSDFLVSLDEGNYTLFKDYNPSPKAIMVIATDSDEVLYTNYPASPNFWPENAPQKSNPYLFAQIESDSTGFNFGSFKQQWNGSSQSMIPLIKTKPTADGNFLDVNFTTKSTFKEGTVGLWQPLGFQGNLTEAELFRVQVTGTAVSGDQTPQMPGKAHLKRIAPTKSGQAPSYVSPISDSDILQSRPVIFDVSGVRIELNNVHNDKMNQFTLNGRYFVLNDPIGNPHADARLRNLVEQPQQLESPTDIKNKAIAQSMEFVDMNPTAFTNKVTTADGKEGYYFMNPSYYQGITYQGDTTYAFDGKNQPTWEALTGIPNDTTTNASGVQVVKSHPSVVNKNSTHYEANKALVDSLPLAQTAEEWYLINNSDVSHPFHIHINPFFVVEVGQLSYEKYGGKKKKPKYDWFMRAVTAESYTQRPEMPTDGTAKPGHIYKGEIGVEAIVGNWWDTITIPAHGYVKVRYWFNVPYQTGEGMDAKVTDNYNRTGIWVYHCHILRHEDRGMMMPVISIANDNDK